MSQLIPDHLLFASDEAYAMPLMVTLASCLENLQRTMKIAICDCGIAAATRRSVEELVKRHGFGDVFWIDSTHFESRLLDAARHQSSATYARLEAPRFLPENSVFIYLDSDILVLDDLGALRIEDGIAVAAVRDFGMPSLVHANHLSSYGLQPETPYFSAGVLLVNNREWLKRDIGDKCLSILAKADPMLPWRDQDALNLALEGNWQEIPARWNVQLGAMYANPSIRRSMREGTRNPAVLHYIGPRKPWHVCKPRAEVRAWLRHCLFSNTVRWGQRPGRLRWLVQQYLRSGKKRLRLGAGRSL